jgi:hypothetical protein
MRKTITQYLIIFLLFQISSSSNNIKTYKSSLHRENGSEKLKLQTESANLNHNAASICVLPITEAVRTDLYGSVSTAINAAASKDMLPQNSCCIKRHVASKSMLPQKMYCLERCVSLKSMLPQKMYCLERCVALKSMLPRNLCRLKGRTASISMLPQKTCCLKIHAVSKDALS